MSNSLTPSMKYNVPVKGIYPSLATLITIPFVVVFFKNLPKEERNIEDEKIL